MKEKILDQYEENIEYPGWYHEQDIYTAMEEYALLMCEERDRKILKYDGIISELTSEKDRLEREKIEYIISRAKILGEFYGTLKGILMNEIPEDLKAKLKDKISELEKHETILESE
jgi:hypothetical protein